MPLLDEIIPGAVSDKTPVQTLLRQCLVLAHQLKNDKLKVWVEQELNGYTDVEALPKYRVVKTVATGSFVGPGGNALNNQPLPASTLGEDLRHWAETAYLTAPICGFRWRISGRCLVGDVAGDARVRNTAARRPARSVG
jgi:AbiTii